MFECCGNALQVSLFWTKKEEMFVRISVIEVCDIMWNLGHLAMWIDGMWYRPQGQIPAGAAGTLPGVGLLCRRVMIRAKWSQPGSRPWHWMRLLCYACVTRGLKVPAFLLWTPQNACHYVRLVSMNTSPRSGQHIISVQATAACNALSPKPGFRYSNRVILWRGVSCVISVHVVSSSSGRMG